MKIIDVSKKEELDLLYSKSAFTYIGINRESIPDLVNWVEENSSNKVEEVYVIQGSLMNKEYGLLKDPYPNDTNIVSIMLEDIVSIVIKKFEIGARWFDDIVDNNERRESER